MEPEVRIVLCHCAPVLQVDMEPRIREAAIRKTKSVGTQRSKETKMFLGNDFTSND